MGFSFSDFSNYGNITNVAQTASNTTNGDSAKWQNGNSYSNQKGNSNTIQEGNKNSYQHGISNSVVVGLRFSTNGAASFSTTAGSSMSTVIGANLPNTEGGKVELIIPMSVKWTRGLYDYDFKSCTSQIKAGFGKATNLYTDTSLTAEQKAAKATKEQTDFIAKLDAWIAEKNLVAKKDIQNVVDGDLQYVTLKTNVASQDTKTVGGAHRVTASVHKWSSIQGGTVLVAANVSIHGGTLRFNGSLVQIG